MPLIDIDNPKDPEFLLTVLRAVTKLAESWCIDWDRMCKESPDYDPEYKPVFPTEVVIARDALRACGVRPISHSLPGKLRAIKEE